jgi:hypothetical protein
MKKLINATDPDKARQRGYDWRRRQIGYRLYGLHNIGRLRQF